MKLYKITSFIDKAFLLTSLILISFVWLKYFIAETFTCLAVSLVISIIGYKIITFFVDKKITKKQLSKQTKEHINQCALSLALMKKEELTDFFAKVISKQKPVCIKDNLIYLEPDDSTTAFCPYYETNTVDTQCLIKILRDIKNSNIDKLIILCNEIDKNASIFAQSITNIQILVYDKVNTYFNLLQKNETYPEKFFDIETSKKYTFKVLLSIAFNRKKSKSYVLCGLIFFVCSWFIQYSLYYVIMSSILFGFAIFSYFNRPYNLPKSSDW